MKEQHLKHDILRAAYYGDLEEIKAAVKEYEYAVCLRDSFTGSTALHFSSGLGNYSCVEFLVTCKHIDLSAKDNSGHDALDKAFMIGHDAICDLLTARIYPYGEMGDDDPDNPPANVTQIRRQP